MLGMSIFGYSQYASASQIEISMTQSELLIEDEKGGKYNIKFFGHILHSNKIRI